MAETKRRAFLRWGLGAGVAATGLWALKPSDESGPRNPYFVRMQAALREAGVVVPTLVVDEARLLANVDALLGHLPGGMGYRVVAKSLPAPELIRRVRQRAGTDRLMTFNLPMLLELSHAQPEADQLLGKPLPVGAAARYFRDLKTPEASPRIQWLVDSPERLAEYGELATGLSTELRINLELDVGLHRGGFVPGPALAAALQTIDKHPRLRFSGLMGYEPHVAAVPDVLGLRSRAFAHALEAYAAARTQVAAELGEEALRTACANGAGSPTYRLHTDTKTLNEVSVGSALVKPTHFDTPLLEDHQPAAFIAAPVIKTMARTQMPALEPLDGLQHAWDPNYRRTLFTYGGHWLAEPVDPPGLRYNPTFGRSSNQEMLTGGPSTAIDVDDFVFFRPTQSEQVLLRFGDIAVYRDGAITGTWRPFAPAA